MSALHLFNPENDLALAAGAERYTPPRAAAEMARCGQLFPMWLAESADSVLVTGEKQMEDAEQLRSQFGLRAAAVTEAPAGIGKCTPWGWSRAARHRLRQAGVDDDALPSDAWLEKHRELSSRLTTIALCREAGLEPPAAAYTPDEALFAVRENETRGAMSYMKMPWSCSGRGVFFTGRMGQEQILRRAEDIIRAQGCVIVEPDRRKAKDFAVLYRIENGEARFHALSMFETDAAGHYRGNLVVSDEAIIDRLGTDPMPQASRMASALTAVVGPHYEGWAGIDMMTTSDGGIYPCIEMNLRCTMGVVAAAMRQYFPVPMLLSPSPALEFPHIPRPLGL